MISTLQQGDEDSSSKRQLLKCSPSTSLCHIPNKVSLIFLHLLALAYCQALTVVECLAQLHKRDSKYFSSQKKNSALTLPQVVLLHTYIHTYKRACVLYSPWWQPLTNVLRLLSQLLTAKLNGIFYEA